MLETLSTRRPNRVGLPTLLLLLVSALGWNGCSSSKKATTMATSSNIVSDVQEFDVDGVHVLLRESGSVPVVSAALFIKGGASAIPLTAPSTIDYFALNLAVGSGTQNIGKSYYRRKMTRMGSTISSGSGRDFSSMSMKCIRENFDTTWAYFTDILLHPAFDTIEYQNLVKNILLNLQSGKLDPDGYTNTVLDSIYFEGHPYGRTTTPEVVRQTTLDILGPYYKSVMVKSRLLLSVVGNISRDELTDKIEATLGKLPEGSYTPIVVNTPVKAMSPGLYYPSFERKLPTDYVLAYFHIPSKGDSDYYPYLRLRNFFGGFVFNHIRVQRNLAYAPNVDEKEWRSSVGTISLQTPYVDSAVKVIFDDVDFFQNNRIRESAIREGVAGWATRNYLKAETTGSQAGQLAVAKLTTGDWHNAFFSYDKLASVTPDQLVMAARKYLRNFNWVIVGDTTHISRKLLESR